MYHGVKESVGAVVRPAYVVGFSNSHSVQTVPPHSCAIITPINSDIFTSSDNRDVNSGTPWSSRNSIASSSSSLHRCVQSSNSAGTCVERIGGMSRLGADLVEVVACLFTLACQVAASRSSCIVATIAFNLAVSSSALCDGRGIGGTFDTWPQSFSNQASPSASL